MTNSFDVALPMDYVICDVLLVLKEKAYLFFGAVSCCSSCKIKWQGHVKRINRELGNTKK